MDRRDFIKLAAGTGLAVAAPMRSARADSPKFNGPFFLSVHCSGGWDPSLLADPKGGVMGDRTTVNQNFTESEIVPVGNFRCAPVNWVVPNNIELYSPARFFTAHKNRTRLFNGVDTSTNNHETGTRLVWSGYSPEGYPALAALTAAVRS